MTEPLKCFTAYDVRGRIPEELNAGMQKRGEAIDERAQNFGLTLLLGIAYSASIGGFATLIGTPPNGVLVTQLPQLFPEAPDLTFSTWMLFALPMSAVYMVLAWLLLTRFVFPLPPSTPPCRTSTRHRPP